MTKRELIMQIRSAKAAHIRCFSSVQDQVRDYQVNETPIESIVAQTDCDFGKWYANEGQILADFPNFIALDEPHQKVHDINEEIFNLSATQLKGSLFSSKKNKIMKRNRQIDTLMEQFYNQVIIINETFNILEHEILNMSDESVERI
jgi:hypothetical protein